MKLLNIKNKIFAFLQPKHRHKELKYYKYEYI